MSKTTTLGRGSIPPAHVEGGQGGHVDDVAVLGAEGHDLHGLVEADEQRADDHRSAQLLQHLRGDRRRVEGGHDQHVGGVGQPAERILRHQLAVERDVGGHFAVILEVDAALVEDAHGLDDLARALAGRMAEGGERQHGDARLVAQPARDACRLDGDLGEFLPRSAFR